MRLISLASFYTSAIAEHAPEDIHQVYLPFIVSTIKQLEPNWDCSWLSLSLLSFMAVHGKHVTLSFRSPFVLSKEV